MTIGWQSTARSLRRKLKIYIILAVLSIYPFSANLSPNVLADTSDGMKVIVDARDGSTLADLHHRGATLLVDYESFSLWRVPSSIDTALLARTSVTASEEFDTIFLRDSSIHTQMSPILPDDPVLRQRRSDAAQLWLVQFVGPIKQAWLDDLRASGLVPVIYMPNHAYVVRGDDEHLKQLEQRVATSPFIQWTGAYHPAYRLAPHLYQMIEQPDAPAVIDVTVQFVTTAATEQSIRNLQAIGGTVYMPPVRIAPFTSISLQVPLDQVESLAQWDDVFNIEPWFPPELLDERQAQIVAGNLRDGAPNGPGYLAWLAQHGFPTTADAYPLIAVVDSGIDTGSAENPLHSGLREEGNPERPSRIKTIINCTQDATGSDDYGHGTLNAGIIAGYTSATSSIDTDNEGYLLGLGLAPYAHVIGTKIFDYDGWFDIDRCSESYRGIVEASYAAGATITSNSWGSSYYAGYYTYSAQTYDALTRDSASDQAGHQPMLHIFAAGNGGPYTFEIGSPATAKNVLSVGATENVRDDGIADGCNEIEADNSNDIAGFSSRGPTNDKRMKPDLVAPGTHIQGLASQAADYTGGGVCGSAQNSDEDVDTRYYPLGQTLYTLSSGTSHATPAVAGAAALLSEYYTRVWNPGQTPSPAMLKALLLNQPRYLTGTGANDRLPSAAQGWGAVQMQSLLETAHVYVMDQDVILNETGQVFEMTGNIPDANAPVAISLVWTDAPGSTTGAAYVNDLNLEVTVNGTVYKGNVFAGAQSQTEGNFDTRNNTERIFLPAGTTGPITLRVTAANLAGDGVPGNINLTDQDFALVAANVADIARIVATDITWNDASGDGIIERSEPIMLHVTLANRGTQALTGIRSELDAPSGDVTLIKATSAYADLPTPGASATNTEAYLLQVSSTLSCNDPILVQQHVFTASGQEFVIDLVLFAGVEASATTYPSKDPELEIPDDDWYGLESYISVPDNGIIADMNVQVNLRHPWVGDIRLVLVSPDDQYIYLVSHPGGGAESGADFRNTIFDDEGVDGSIEDATPPYTGSFAPLEPLSIFDGTSMHGSWNLVVLDQAVGDVGVLESWSLAIQPRSRVCSIYRRTLYFPVIVSQRP